MVVSVETKPSTGTTLIGIDLGCKDAATASNGETFNNGEYRKFQQQLGIAQRARKKHRVKAIHAKITNRRKDNIHKFTRNLVNTSGAVFVGNVKPLAMVKTNMAKSVLDAGWGSIKTILEYKCAHAGIVFAEINEAIQPKPVRAVGLSPTVVRKVESVLVMRHWRCNVCGSEHDRDLNAALNIAAAGHRRLAEGILACGRESS